MSARQPSAPPEIPGYRYLELLGMGGFADVFLYEQRSMGSRKVAVKVLLQGLRSDTQQAFEDEARAMARLSSHPSIVSVIDAGQTPDGRAYLVMEHCPGAHLGSQVRNRPLNLAKALEVAIQVAGAVETAHAAGIIHRDIKPANILFTEYNRPALTDFGISTSTTSNQGKAVGVSVPWAPPEQLAAGAETDVTGDVYSLAATLYTVLTGHPPFWRAEGPNDSMTMGGRIVNDPVPPLGRDDVPASLQRVLDVAMSKNTRQRYPTALEFARALQQVQLELHLPVTAADVRVELVQVESDDETEFGGTIAAEFAIEATPTGSTTEMADRSGPGFTGGTAQVAQTELEAEGMVPRVSLRGHGSVDARGPVEFTGPVPPVVDDGRTELSELSLHGVMPGEQNHRTRPHVALWAVAALVVLVIVAGGVVFLTRGTSAASAIPTSPGVNSSSTNASSAPAAATKGGTLNILMSTKMEHWDPQRVYAVVNTEAMNRLFIRTLVSWSTPSSDTEVAKVVPDLATDTGKVSADGKTWSFTLKDGVKWQDGQDITADDVKYGISRTFAVDVITGGPNYAIAFLDIPFLADGSSAYKGPYAKTGQDLYDKAVTVSGKTITFKLSQPVMDFNNLVTMTAFAPFRQDKDLGDKSNYALFSSGPYKLDGVWTAAKGGSFVRNASWDPATDTIRKAYPDKIVWEESLTPETLYERLIADQGNDKNAITYDQAPVTALANIGNAPGRNSIVASPYTRYLVPNFKSKVMSNDKARQALALATNRSAYVTAAGGPLVAVATNSLISPNMLAFPNTPLPAGDMGDPATAKELLQASGLTLPVTISVTYRKSDTLDKAFAGLKAGWDAAGFNTQLIALPPETYYSTLEAPESASKYDVYWASWGADYPSASTDIPPLFDSRLNISAGGPGEDFGYFTNDDFNAKIDATNKIADMTSREKAWGELDVALTSTFYACIPLINDEFVFMHGSNVQGVFVNGSYYDPATVSLKS
jgi:peptide/nickel transport system substrate-binding protein